jgi:heme o synthase
MKTTTVCTEALPLARSRWQDFIELTKPRIAVLVLFTVAIGALLARRGTINWEQLVHTLLGTALVAAGASALNQLLERHSDGLMRRTENRPLPAGRLHPLEVLAFGLTLGVLGTAYLAVSLRQPLAAGIAALTFLSYVLLYTPLKRRTTLNTLVGAVPGALPPVIGWTAATGRLDREAIVLFLILFLWQVPHFLAIAWIYREDYGRAGLKMLPVLDVSGSMTGRQMVIYCLALIPISLMPVLFHQAGIVYGLGALALGLFFLRAACGFVAEKTAARARRVLHASLLYLPALLALLLVETIRNSL